MSHGRKRRCVAVGFLLAISAFGAACKPTAKAGVLDLRGHSLRSESYSLRGAWKFWPQQLPAPESQPEQSFYQSVPGNWNSIVSGGIGVGAYELLILLPEGEPQPPLALELPPQGVASRCYVNGQLISSVGVVADRAADSIPAYRSELLQLPAARGALRLRCLIANFFHRSGGMWFAPEFGDAARLDFLRRATLLRDFALAGALALIGIYQFSVFIGRRNSIDSLAFGCFAFLMSIRTLFTGRYLAYAIWPDAEWQWMVRIEYLSHILALPCVAAYAIANYGGKERRFALALVWSAGIGFALHTLFFSVRQFSGALTPYQALIGLFVIYFLITLIRCARRGQSGAQRSLVGATPMALAVFNDILYSRGLLDTGYVAPLGLLFWMTVQSYETLSTGSARHAVDLETPAQTRSRPAIILICDLVGSEEGTAVTDARGRQYLHQVLRPVLLNRNGFEFSSQSLVAARFFDSAEAATEAALDIKEALREMRDRGEPLLQQVRCTMGIHVETSIAPSGRQPALAATQSVSELQSLAATMGAEIVLSAPVLAQLRDPGRYQLRMIARHILEAGAPECSVYELLHRRDALAGAGDLSLPQFEEGVRSYLRGNFSQAREFFATRLSDEPQDNVARYYWDKSSLRSEEQP
ncbi:MAG: hypothetical protein K1X75_01140 [Leptospirales bacterium]|nr:hypothetical protein [Leptospirales bacterium]